MPGLDDSYILIFDRELPCGISCIAAQRPSGWWTAVWPGTQGLSYLIPGLP